MNTKFYLTVVMIASLCFNLYAGGDLEKFSTNTEDFLEELEAYMTISHKEEMIPIFKEFEQKFRSGVYTDIEEARIIELNNQMLAKKMSAKPFFSSYIRSITIIKKGKNGSAHFNQWHDVTEKLLAGIEGRKFNEYKAYLTFSFDFFNRGALKYSASGISWIAVTEDYRFAIKGTTPELQIENFDLICTRKDRIIDIEGTSGVFYPLSQKWKGTGGKVSWERVQMPEVYAQLNEYTIYVKKGSYQAEKAHLHFPKYFSQPVEGRLEDKIIIAKDPSYPRFISTDQRLTIPKLAKGVKYKGGFKLEGSNIYGVSTQDARAQMQFFDKQDKLVLNCTSESFIIRKGENIAGEGLEICLYIGEDSITHVSSNLKYDVEKGKISLFRGKKGRDRNPYFSSFHNVNINIDRIDRDINTGIIEFGKKVPDFINANKRVDFESLSYYSEKDYLRYQNVADYNPISILRIISEKEGSRILNADFFASKLNSRFKAKNIHSLLYDLTEDGFIDYLKEENKIIVKQKVIHYSDASRQKTDFDNIKLTSISEETNGILNLENNDLIVNGIKNFEFSREHKIAAIPTGKQVLIKENRDLEFDGDLFAGFGLFTGRGYHFDYEQFEIKMDSVRFMDLYLPSGELDKNGDALAYAMDSRLEYLSGTLVMDAPENKSGTSKIDMFPIFNSSGPSYVYYDKKRTLNGCYHRDSFFFELDPFFLEDMDKQIQNDLDFTGTMKSASIFPDFKEKLVLQEDQSLGFIHNTPETGYPAYQQKGNFKGEMNLSNKGLFGKGKVSYKWASIDADKITFKPNQLLTSAKNFEVSEVRSDEVSVPQVKGYDVSIDWKPYKDSMYIQSLEKPFELFQKPGYTLENLLILTPDGIKGRGTFNSNRGILNAHLISFEAFSAQSDTADLQIKASGVDHLALDTKNVYAKLDFDKQMGYVKANKEDIITTLPYNKYQTDLNEYDWDMQAETITFKTKEKQLGNFLSIHDDQDSLAFQGTTALYDLKTNELKLGGVPEILTADAIVVPEQGNVDVRPGGMISTLKNAKITANKYHVINKANVDIKGRKEYSATGYYQYDIGYKKQEIYFPDIKGMPFGKGKKSKKQIVSKASGSVQKEDRFYMDYRTLFNGKITLQADRQNLQFEGFAKLDVKKMKNPDWFSVNCEADKKNMLIPYNEPKNEYGDKIKTGWYISRENLDVYPLVMQALPFGKDRLVFEASGLLRYKGSSESFIMGDSLRVVSGVDYGNVLTYSDKDGSIKMQGKFNLGPVDDEMVSVVAGGQVETSVIRENASRNMTTMAGINFHLPKSLMDYVVNDITASSFDASIISYRPHDFYEQALSEMIDNSKTRSTQLSNIMSAGYMDIPKDQNPYTIFFDQLPLKWIPDYQSFVTTREQLGIISMNGQMLNRNFKSFVEFKLMSNGENRMYIYLEAPSGTYYFFAYRDGILSTVSNNEKYNQMVEGLKKKEKSIKLKDDTIYEIQLVNPGTANAFVNRVKAAKDM